MQANRSAQVSKRPTGTKKPSEPKSAKARSSSSQPREGSVLWAAIEVLRGQDKPMTAREIYAQICERGLAPSLKGKTPEQTVAARLAVSAKRGLLVERTDPGKFRFKSER
jgi:HB1, ASXL, restriction endonuclease HTH domain